MKTLKGIINKLKGFVAGKKEWRESYKCIHITEEGSAIASDGCRVVSVDLESDIKACTIPAEYVAATKNQYEEAEITVEDLSDSARLLKDLMNDLGKDDNVTLEFKASAILAELKRLYQAQGFKRLTLRSGIVQITKINSNYEMRFVANKNVNIMFDGQKLKTKGDMWFAKDITNLVTETYSNKKKVDIFLNAKYLFDALSLYDKKEVVTFGFISTLSPCSLIGKSVKNLILPVRVRESFHTLPVKYIEKFDAEWNAIQEEKIRRSEAAEKISAPVEEVVVPAEVVEEIKKDHTETATSKDDNVVEVVIKNSTGRHILGRGVIDRETKTLFKVRVTTSYYGYKLVEGETLSFKKVTLTSKEKFLLEVLDTLASNDDFKVDNDSVEQNTECTTPAASGSCKLNRVQLLSKIKNPTILYEIAKLLKGTRQLSHYQSLVGQISTNMVLRISSMGCTYAYTRGSKIMSRLTDKRKLETTTTPTRDITKRRRIQRYVPAPIFYTSAAISL